MPNCGLCNKAISYPDASKYSYEAKLVRPSGHIVVILNTLCQQCMLEFSQYIKDLQEKGDKS